MNPTAQALILAMQFSVIIFSIFWAHYSTQRDDLDRDIKRLQRRRRILLHRLMKKRESSHDTLEKTRQPYLSHRARSCWAYPTSSTFWECTVPAFSHERFMRVFRVSRNTFHMLCERLKPLLERSDTSMRRAVPLEKRVAVALTMLRSTSDCGSVADLYGIGKSTVCYIMKEFCDAVLEAMYTEVVWFPVGEDFEKVVHGFESYWQFPNCAGVMAATHIPIITPSDNSTDYCNKKNWHSIVFLVVVDHEYKFRFVDVGLPGGYSNAAVLQSTPLYQQGVEGQLLPEDLHLLGDSSFPLLPWLVTPYSEAIGMPEEQSNFNSRLQSARTVIDIAMRRLNGRWRIFLKKCDIKLDNMIRVVKACCVLHNLCEENGDAFYEEWDHGASQFNIMFPQPLDVVPSSRHWNYRAWEKRDELAHDLML